MAGRLSTSREPSHIGFRLTTLVFAVLLGAQSVWLLLAELSRSSLDVLPTNAPAALAAARERGTARWAAMIGGVRGDLWAQYAFTYADLVVGANVNPASGTVPAARLALDRALANAPTESPAWLLLSGLDMRYPEHGSDPVQALKMSYYTGPSDEDLIALRFIIAVQMNRFGDIEINQFVTRDLRLLVGQKQIAIISDGYRIASADGKHFIAQALGDLDPALMTTIQAGAVQQQPPLPN